MLSKVGVVVSVLDALPITCLWDWDGLCLGKCSMFEGRVNGSEILERGGLSKGLGLGMGIGHRAWEIQL